MTQTISFQLYPEPACEPESSARRPESSARRTERTQAETTLHVAVYEHVLAKQLQPVVAKAQFGLANSKLLVYLTVM